MQTKDTDRNKIIDRIKKLMSLGDSSRNGSESEVFEALSRARTLMAEYDIKEDEISAETTGEVKREWEFYSEIVPTTGNTIQTWEDFLIVGVARITHTSVIKHRNNGRGMFIKVYGEKIDVHLCIALFTLLRNHARRISEQFYKTRTDRRSYQEGFAGGIQQQAKQKVKELSFDAQNQFAIVTVEKKTWLDKKMSEKDLKEKISTKGIYVNPYAYQHGVKDGKSINTEYKQKALK